MKKIIITAGGTSEPIDNVRKITNSSTGKLGSLICNELLNKDSDSTIYYIHSKNAILPEYNNRIKFIPIETTKDLENTIKNLLSTEKFDIFIHSMAVSDYTTNAIFSIENLIETILENKDYYNDVNNYSLSEKTTTLIEKLKSEYNLLNNNKISSNHKNLLISLKPTNKIISMIKEYNPHIFLVGFKLLDNVLENDLFDVGFNLLRKNKCNLVLANDLSLIRNNNHTGLIIYPEKKYDKIIGKDNIASSLVNIIYKRAFVGHSQSKQISEDNNLFEKEFQQFSTIGNKLFKLDILPEVINHNRVDKIGTYGNMSIRDKFSKDNFFITGRNVHKGYLKENDICYINKVNDLKENNPYCVVKYGGIIKPSIDTAIHNHIYKLTNFNAIIHIHTDKVFLDKPITDYNYPCGSKEEKDSIIKFIENNPKEDVIQLYKHGLIVLGDSLSDCYSKILNLFNNGLYIDYSRNCIINNEFFSHIKEVKAEHIIKNGFLHCIYKEKTQIGVLWEHIEENYINFAIYGYKENKGKGNNIAKKIIEMYGDKRLFLHTMKDCNIQDFYINKFGFEIYAQLNDYSILTKQKRVP